MIEGADGGMVGSFRGWDQRSDFGGPQFALT